VPTSRWHKRKRDRDWTRWTNPCDRPPALGKASMRDRAWPEHRADADSPVRIGCAAEKQLANMSIESWPTPSVGGLVEGGTKAGACLSDNRTITIGAKPLLRPGCRPARLVRSRHPFFQDRNPSCLDGNTGSALPLLLAEKVAPANTARVGSAPSASAAEPQARHPRPRFLPARRRGHRPELPSEIETGFSPRSARKRAPASPGRRTGW